MMRFDGKAVIVTGAGGGLGREYALLFAERGASVVVNDLGTTALGDGQSSSLSDTVVQEIRNNGGKAVANYDSVEHGDKIVKCALDHFGRVDIVINNAGILRDKQFKNISEDDWDTIFRVHVKGAFSLVKAAWSHLCSQKYGRIIFTSSNSGLYGNFGQVNYSAAKASLIGFSNALSKEGQRYNVFSNVIVPTAASRLTKSIIPDEMLETFQPGLVAPMVGWLCHETCQENGGVFEAAGGWYGKVEHWRGAGKVLLNADTSKVVPEQIRDNWSTIADMSQARNFDSVSSEYMDVVNNIEFFAKPPPAKPSNYLEPTKRYRNSRFEPSKFEYTTKDAILYALSIGATVDKHLHLLYENHENFTVFPLFAVVPNASVVQQLIHFQIPGLNLNFANMLHGEQYFEFKKPFEPQGKLISQCHLAHIMDKGSALVALLNVDIKDQNNEQVITGQYGIYFRNSGGFGGDRNTPTEIKPVPVPTGRKPDFVVEEKTCPTQAALYRQASGDFNPFHIDPNYAKLAGFSSPILHGLCSLGFSTKHVLDKVCPNDYSKLKAVKVRFTKAVFPGQTLVTEMWKGADDRVHFQTKVKETGTIVLGSGYMDFYTGNGRPVKTSAQNSQNRQATDLKCRAVFQQMKQRLTKDPSIVKQIQAIYLWIINRDGAKVAVYTADLKNGGGSIFEGEPTGNSRPDVTLTIDDQDLVDLVDGKLNAQKAFMSGKLKLKGNIMLSQKLQKLFNESSKL